VQDSRGIVFVKTREMTVALVNWMIETEELKELNPHNLVGTNAPSQKAGKEFQRDFKLHRLADAAVRGM
jgi:ATP-dependent RNA helicase DDX58